MGLFESLTCSSVEALRYGKRRRRNDNSGKPDVLHEVAQSQVSMENLPVVAHGTEKHGQGQQGSTAGKTFLSKPGPGPNALRSFPNSEIQSDFVTAISAESPKGTIG